MPTDMTILPIESLDITALRRDGGTQPRAALDQATIGEYAEALAQGDTFPPVVVFFDGAAYWLADGFHRVAALERLAGSAGGATVQTVVHQGSQRDAVLYSTGVNATHGLRRTNADKRRAVDVLLRDREWSQWSNREIARQARVGEHLVRSMRELSAPRAQIDAPTQRTVTRAGATYVMDTAKIGVQTPAAPEAITDPARLQNLVRSWLGTRVANNHAAARIILYQISLGNHVGVDNLNAFGEWLRRANLTATTTDIKRAMLAVQVELTAAQPAPAVTQPASAPEPAPASIPTAEDIARAAADLEPQVWRWLNLPTTPTRNDTSKTLRLVNSCLDVEGFHARRGRNYDWEALIGALGNGADHTAVRQALRNLRTHLTNRLQEHDAPYATLITAATKALGVLKASAGADPDELEAIRLLETALANLYN